MTREGERIIPLTAIDRLFAQVPDGLEDFEPKFELGRILENIAMEILEIARKMRAHAKRKTLMDTDLQIAFDTWKKKNLKDTVGDQID
jgi:histone H3/H4